MVKGNRYQLLLDCETERQALARLALFEQDPASYKTPSAQRGRVRTLSLLTNHRGGPTDPSARAPTPAPAIEHRSRGRGNRRVASEVWPWA
jgi:hypothetical protein